MCEIYLNQFRISLRNFIKDFVDDEEAIGTVEMILILIVLIALVIIFRDQLKTIVNNLFDKITTQSNSV
ncbi:MAG: holin, BlyA family protein [Lachnospiraceae bacterium]|nr:holin, BlyA family protein [Lachnospiraceae bacterium]MBR0148439.1 holin, BlyA family protein [Lachnospiraceae bacterium]MBR4174848.1 holin, BlyA family protein [Lachnospiraceae bacterium]